MNKKKKKKKKKIRPYYSMFLVMPIYKLLFKDRH